jgi:hypothetical protein
MHFFLIKTTTILYMTILRLIRRVRQFERPDQNKQKMVSLRRDGSRTTRPTANSPLSNSPHFRDKSPHYHWTTRPTIIIHEKQCKTHLAHYHLVNSPHYHWTTRPTIIIHEKQCKTHLAHYHLVNFSYLILS